MRARTWWRMCMVAASLACGAAPAMAQKSADTLRVTWRDAIPNLDFYYNSLRNGYIIQIHAQDGLVYRDPDTFQIKPLLATSWKPVDDTTIDFELRQGVTFHNGDKFSADDVVYTINGLLNDKDLAVPSNYLFLAGAEKLDDYHVRIKLKRVFPAALQYIAMVMPIYPQAYREKVGHDGFSKAPIGTGPYKITKVDGINEIDLERNDAYFADSPKARPAIRFIKIHEVADAATEMAELLGGRADWIWDFSPDQFNSVAAMPTLTALRAETMRVAYLQIDAGGRTGADNPLTKEKVRQAIAYSLDRATMAKQLMQGNSRPLDAPCFPTQFGCDQAAAVHYTYDPAKAKQLLAEAGYPNGIDTELVTYLLPQWNGAHPGLSAGRGYPRAYQPVAGLGRDPAGAGWQDAVERRKLGQLFDQRRLRVSAVLLQRLDQRLCAQSGDHDACHAGWVGHRSGSAPQGLQRGDQADHRAGGLRPAVHLRKDLRLLAAAQLQGLS